MSKMIELRRSWFGPVIVVALLVAVVVPASATPCQEKSIFEAYDVLLPIRDADARPSIQTVTVRYIPADTSRERETKVRLSETADGSVSLTVWYAKGRSIQQQLRDLRSARPDACDDQLIATIELERTEFSGPDVTKRLRALRSLRVRVLMESAIYLDTARFEIAVDSVMNQSTFVLYGPGTGESRPHPLIKWADSLVRSTAPRHLKTSN